MVMELKMLSLINLFMVFGRIQNAAWSTLPAKDNRIISSLNARQIKAMMHLYVQEKSGGEPLTLNQIGSLLSIRKAAASLMVSDLSDKKLVVRKVDENNRRFIRIHLTATGRRLGDAIMARGTTLSEELFRKALASGLEETELNGFMKTADCLCRVYNEQMEADE